MNYDIEDVTKGVADGITRAGIHYQTDSFQIKINTDVVGTIDKVLLNWSDDLHPRFVRLFSELVALAQATRHANNEALLVEDELMRFLCQAAWFFNSFKHDLESRPK